MQVREYFYEQACFTINQVYAVFPHFDRNNLSRWIKKERLIRLRNGFFMFPEYSNVPGIQMYVANFIYRPSYVSLHSSLAFYGLIPEAVIKTVSVSSLKTAEFSNSLGQFAYRTVKASLMFGYDPFKMDTGHTYYLAKAEKALLDLFYLFPEYDHFEAMEAMRFNVDILHNEIDFQLMEKFLGRINSKALNVRYKTFLKAYEL